MNLGVIAMKENLTFSKAPGLEPHELDGFSVITRTLVGGGVLPLWRGAVSVFYSPSQMGGILFDPFVVLSPADSCRIIHIYTGYIPTQ